MMKGPRKIMLVREQRQVAEMTGLLDNPLQGETITANSETGLWKLVTNRHPVKAKGFIPEAAGFTLVMDCFSFQLLTRQSS